MPCLANLKVVSVCGIKICLVGLNIGKLVYILYQLNSIAMFDITVWIMSLFISIIFFDSIKLGIVFKS